MMEAENLDTKRWVDPHTSMVPKLIADICQHINKEPEVPDQRVNHAINCRIHFERRNRARTQEWLRAKTINLYEK